MKHLLRSSIACFSLLGALLCGSQEAQAQYLKNDPIPNGNIGSGEYGDDTGSSDKNKQVSSQGGKSVAYFMTWSSTTLYIAVRGLSTDRAVVYFDANPIVPVNGGDRSKGLTDGYAPYDRLNINSTLTAKLPFRADLALAINNDKPELRIAGTDNTWTVISNAITTFGYSADGNVREVAIDWSAFPSGQRPTDFNYLAFITTTTGANNIYGALPSDNDPPVAGGPNNPFSYYYTINGTDDKAVNIGPGGQAQGLFARESYTKSITTPSGNTTLSGFDSNNALYDFTVNGNNGNGSSNNQLVSITRSDSGTPTWLINHNLYVGNNATISAGPSTASITVKGNLIVADGGRFNQDNARLTVGGNLLAPFGGFTSIGDGNKLTFNGSVTQAIDIANLRASNVEFTGVGSKILSSNLNIYKSISLSGGARLYTGDKNTLTLEAGSTLEEGTDNNGGNGGGYVFGNVVSVENLSTQKDYTFNNLGLTLRPYGPAYPGSVTVRRVTGSALQGPGRGNNSVFRQYVISVSNDAGQQNNKFDLGFTFGYRTKQENELNGIQESDLQLFRSDTYDVLPYKPFDSEVNTSNHTVSIRTEIQLNGTFTLGDINRPLPVELSSFSGQYANNSVLLKWTTASEKNNKGFGVERRVGEGSNWQQVGFVAGKSATGAAYSYVDATAPQGTSYYRLRQEDNDGTTAYSPVVAVLVAGQASGTLALSPVPTADQLTISGFGDGQHVAEVYNLRGQRVLTQQISNAQATLSVSTLPSGVYLVRVQGAGAAQKGKFVKL